MTTEILDTAHILRLADDYGMTDQQICKITGRTKCTVWRWRTGRSRPHLTAAVKLVRALANKELKEEKA